MSLLLQGTGASPGIVIAKAHIFNRDDVEIIKRDIPEAEIDDEIARFKVALKKTHDYLSNICSSFAGADSQVFASIADVHLKMLDDYPLSCAPLDFIRAEQCNAEWAMKHERDKLTLLFQQMEDSYLKARGDDVTQLCKLILSYLSDQDQNIGEKEKQNMEGKIIVANDLTPADTVFLNHCRVSGFVTELGGATSHTAILARSISIPAVVGAHQARRLLRENETIILDGKNGIVIADTTPDIITIYNEKIAAETERKQQLTRLRYRKAISSDGITVEVMANVELDADIEALETSGADGVGLYRTEFLYANRESPADENEQYETYRKVVETMAGKPVTIRTLDLGGDKEFDPERQGSPAMNPALGLRAIRRSLKEPESFLTQLKAIMRVAALGPVKILLPMITNAREITQIEQLLQRAGNELAAQGSVYANVPVGAMIEVPAAALQADYMATRLDFLSIGTNDLIQYTLAIDRIDDEVSHLYEPMHPGVLLLIRAVLEAGRKTKTPVAMCGEMACDPLFTRLLLGMGLREFSAHPNNLLEIKESIISSNIGELREKCCSILEPAEPEEIYKRIAEL